MNGRLRFLLRPTSLACIALFVFPLLRFIDAGVFQLLNVWLSDQLTTLFVYAILALGLNVVVGYAGLLHLGIGAFFGIGAYLTGILTVPSYPFQVGFLPALVLSTLGAALAGLVLSAPTLRLRGDYLAIVTLGFGEVVKFSLKNLEEITAGSRGLNPVPAPHTPDWFASLFEWLNVVPDRAWKYYVVLAILALVVLLLANLERSRLGRAWVAVREDELAARCMGINVTWAKLSALVLGAGLAGMAGCLYATVLGSTADPEAYSFNRSIIILSCIIVGGLGSLRGTLLGVLLIQGFDQVAAKVIDEQLQRVVPNPDHVAWLTFTNWTLMVYGLALILVMRFRPEGLWPARRMQLELHAEANPVAANLAGVP